ncbi:Na/Pi cotransporter family protein [Bradyrhizobium iriomotense]|uniref:Sodium:proton antiporter n=1 Tax=Bradyrhizobium iriomotense TaxID=441950 RepID=A0ABQ6B204_9BRAD|nr:Na/Pi symporter [Bradyrhizobium iriomotense]GLR88432.1 hypothetical protein GCM10007857_51440 [Bradyrhizobium iriomotense]
MSTAISVLGGVGLFLLGMTVMTEGLKVLAGSALRTVLSKAAATPLHGSFWGAIVTLLVQSSSATTMTTIGLVSAGLLTFQQGLGLVFGANIGTTGTGWLVALIGVRVSLTAAALPMIFAGALTKLLARGRISGAGAALAGFGLVLFGLTTLQQGMGGLAERLHPADLPAVLTGPDGRWWWSGLFGALVLVVTGLVMTALMQSSTAAVAVTLSGYFAGAIGLDQACALIIGQNIGTATSSALAAIGASTTAKRLAIAYVLFKLIAAVIALGLFPVVIPLLVRASDSIDGVTLLAGYHTAYNVVGVVVLLPLVDRFTRLVERILPERGSPLTRCLDPSALATPIVAVEAVRRTIARVLVTVCTWVEAALAGRAAPVLLGKDAVSMQDAAEALRQAQIFLSEVTGPPDTEDEQQRMTSTLHALDHASRLTDVANSGINFASVADGPEDIRAGELCAEAMRSAAAITRGVAVPPHPSGSQPVTPVPHGADAMTGPRAIPTDEAIAELERCATQLGDVLRTHRSATLGAVASATLSTDAALVRVETVRNLQAMAHHAWRSAAHLVGRG